VDYLDGLNEEQRKAVEHTEGPVMVIAGAGSGKTRVLTYRIANIIRKGVDPFHVLSLTFTNKAAREMKARIGSIVGESEAKNIWMGTFHSIFARILRYEAEKIGYPSNFTIYDSDDSKSLIRTILKEFQLDDKIYKPGLVLNRISSAKNNLLSAAAYKQNNVIYTEDSQAKKPLLGKIYEVYERRCFQSGAMDFDDLLFKTNILLRDFPEVLYKYQEKFRYILVDEFQDTNFSQYVILKKLAARFENICVVGDDAQSIYAFRGANIQNILSFQQEYPDAAMYKLEQNYRSTKNIVEAANSIISKNKDQLRKEVWTSNDIGNKIKVSESLTDNEEGLFVANQISEQKLQNQLSNAEFAILYRTNAQSRAMEEGLRKRNIPYKVYGGVSFYQRKEIKDLLSYYRLSLNQNDEEALKRVINYPARGIGKTTMEKIMVAANDNQVSPWEVVNNLNNYNIQLGAAIRTKLGDFATMIKSFVIMLPNQSAFDIGNHIASASGILKELYIDKTPEGVSRYENIQELLNGLKDFSEQEADGVDTSMSGYMQDIALLTDTDVVDKNNPDTDKVSLMTIHAAKGLEFPVVFVVGLEENLFPSQMALNSRTDLEEERRLFYVAVTRAEKQAYLTYATSRYRWGNLTYCEPSRFIEEIDLTYLEYASRAMSQPKARIKTEENSWDPEGKTTTTSSNFAPPKRRVMRMGDATSKKSDFEAHDTSNLQSGMKVLHERFGEGKVLNIEGNPPNQKATVFFQKFGQKQLLLKFAKLQIVE